MARRLTILCGVLMLAAIVGRPDCALAQQTRSVQGRHFPLNQYTLPGVAAEWATNAGHATPGWFQPVKVSLPSTGQVTFFDGHPSRPVTQPAPAQAALLVGRMYRFCVSDLPEFPGQEFWPSLELIDQLHPPVGQIDRFPMTFELTEEELDMAVNGRLVTKVIYLEQPDRVPLANLEPGPRIIDIGPSQNPLAEADLLGRPVAILRIGGRTPDPQHPDPQFFGPGFPVRLRVDSPAPTPAATTQRIPQPAPALTAIEQHTVR